MKPRTSNTIDDIRRFVAAGHSQSPANCRVLLDEINRLAGNQREDWKPIASAPRDGTLIQIVYTGTRGERKIDIGAYDRVEEAFRSNIKFGVKTMVFHGPTHWKHLDALPVVV